MKISQSGRSMVEMLGVLAIIGVLSAGGLAGYSKAMKQHKLNIQREQISSLIAAEMTYQEQIGVPEDAPIVQGAYDLVPIYKSLNAIPESMLIPNNNLYLKDKFENRVVLYTYANKDWHAIRIELNTAQNISNCINIFETAKNYSLNLWKVAIWKNTVTTLFEAMGDKYCSSDAYCLKDITIANYPNTCEVCKNIQSCQMYIWVE